MDARRKRSQPRRGRTSKPPARGTPNEQRKIIREYIEGESPEEIEQAGRSRRNTDIPLK